MKKKTYNIYVTVLSLCMLLTLKQNKQESLFKMKWDKKEKNYDSISKLINS